MPYVALEQNRSQQAIVLMVRPPEAAHTKRRLEGPLTEEEVARLYEAFLDDYSEKLRVWQEFAVCFAAVACDDVTPELTDAIRRRLGPAVEVIPQPAGSSGDRLRHLISSLWDEHYRRIVFLGSDAPSLPPELVRDALEWLVESDIVLGPNLSGGTYCIGVRDLVPGLFQTIPWGTREVFGATIARARMAGLTVQMLEFWNDVDTPDDLRFLYHHLAAQASHERAHGEGFPGRHTWEYLNRLTSGRPLESDRRFKGIAPPLPLAHPVNTSGDDDEDDPTTAVKLVGEETQLQHLISADTLSDLTEPDPPDEDTQEIPRLDPPPDGGGN